MDPADDPRPLTAGVIGWPITHSKSPAIFEHWFREHAIPGRYCHLAVAAEDFESVFRALPKAGFRGVNVTIPHKEAALVFSDRQTETARRIGAANMIRFLPDHSILADNTDGIGFLANLQLGAPGWRPSQGAAAILGAGGAARAILVSLIEAGCPDIRLVNRTRARAEDLARDLGGPITVVGWEERADALDGAATLVNTTSLGMKGAPSLDLPLDALPGSALVTDIVYSPLITPLLAAARARGNPVVDGLGMLLHQARPAFHAWFGVDPTVDDRLREIVLR
ncbi:MAG: shikimate dehydrogenase [Pseudomonadota bacterium]